MTGENCSCTAKMRLLSNPAAQHWASGNKLKQQKHIISIMKIISVLCSRNSKEIPTTTIHNRGGGGQSLCSLSAKLQFKVIEGRHVYHVLSMWYMSLKTTHFKITIDFLILQIENISVLITLSLYEPWKYHPFLFDIKRKSCSVQTTLGSYHPWYFILMYQGIWMTRPC